ncbi:MAG: ATP-dependent DNA helicase RecG [Anaerolineales bacterium]|nr:ATP-dependent DNA helicase RecG [Anaerolineales bacterium]
MLPSLEQLQKMLKAEIAAKYNNKAVIGGLPKMLAFWEPNARREQIDAEAIADLVIRIKAYPELPQDKRPLAIAELLDLVQSTNDKEMVKRRGSAPARPEPKPAAPAPRPQPQRPPTPPQPRPAQPERTPKPPFSKENARPQPNAQREQNMPRENRAPREPNAPREQSAPYEGGAPRSQPVPQKPRPVPSPAPKPTFTQEVPATGALQPAAKEPHKPAEHSQHGRSGGDRNSFAVEPLDPRPRKIAPRPLKSLDPVDPNAGLDAPITVLKGVGPETAKDYERLEVRTLRDLLLYFPRRYDNYSKMKTINRLEYGEECTLIATVWEVRERKFRANRAMLKVVLSDGTGMIEVTEFNPYRKQLLQPGRQVVVSGRVDQYLGRLTIVPREWERLDVELLNTGRIVPVYSLTEGIYQRSMRSLTSQIVNYWAPKQPDPLPADMVERTSLLAYGEALAQIHFPDSEPQLEAAQHRLAFDELLALQIGVLRQRRQWQSAQGQALPVEDAWLMTFTNSLPYQLTNAQTRALADVRGDMSRPVPMNRLLQGDVGSGKTAVAAVAMAQAVQAGAQAALMVPTSILAEQHFKTISTLLAASDGTQVTGDVIPNPQSLTSIRLLQGSTSKAEKEEIYAGLRSGEVKVVVGTHALIENPVEFANLGLVVIDEQHRFGVAQRAALRGKGATAPHLLVMTATPIPRTLALSVYGDLDLSILDEMPPGRQPIGTHILHANERERGYAFVRREVQKGRQAFLIFPLVEESEKSEAKAAVAEHERLQKEVFPELKLGLLHGRLKPDEKDAVMQSFRAGEFHILVSTSVVEVGVDVPNASVILIDGANRFGLSQLHQFRGRVGRGEHASYCLLVSDSPHPEPDERLKAMEATQDGFKLAEKDLDLRGPGDFLGTRQSGFAGLHTARLSDIRTIEKARREAIALFERDPELSAPEHAGVANLVNKFWHTGSGDVS